MDPSPYIRNGRKRQRKRQWNVGLLLVLAFVAAILGIYILNLVLDFREL